MKVPVKNFERILAETSLNDIMRKAYSAQILIPAFNIAYIPMLKSIANTLKEFDCFGLLEVARADIEKFGAQSLLAVHDEYEKYSDKAYMRLHQDHVPVIDEDGELVDWEKLIKKALDLGYDSVMIDGSRLNFKENVRISKKVANMGHEKGIPVEAELGAVLGHEKGPLPPYEELYSSGKGFTDQEEAQEFVEATGVDWLSVAIGNIHGAVSGAARDKKKVNARLNIEHLRRIVSVTGVPIVLHGGSGIKQNSVLDGIRNGVTKINIGTAIRQRYEASLRATGSVESAQQRVKEEITMMITKYYQIRGSARRLASLIEE